MLVRTSDLATADIPVQGKRFALALGCFDGVHKGHAALFDALLSRAEGRIPAAWTFSDAELSLKKAGRIFPTEEKLRLIGERGVPYAFLYRFSELADLSPETFVSEILVGECGCGLAVCGYDFTFGRGASGSAETLSRLLEPYGVPTVILPPVADGEGPISSHRVRLLLGEGRMEDAARLLGRPYFLSGTVEHGARLGRELGFPTINLSVPADAALPRRGVYVSLTELDGRSYRSVTNVGTRPTVSGAGVNCETHLFDYRGSAYGKRARVELLSFLREEERFSSEEELAATIERDKRTAAAYFRPYPAKKGGAEG
ncbi:MAG: riboflavin biosynthesis protein RibF [Clostridia bacterium]|nr:riboflavin biosynthesis protein RibF [Clostridia bacterium]